MPRGVDRYDEALQQGRLWTPQVWRGSVALAVWWDASVGPFTHVAGDGVSVWRDLSGNGRDATFVSATARPALLPVGWNVTGSKSNQSVRGDGSNDGGGYTQTTYAGATGQSVRAVVNNSGAASIRDVVGGATAGCLELRITATQKVEVIRSFQLSLFTTTASVPSGPAVIGCDMATNLTRAWINGASEQNSTNPAIGNTNGSVFYSAPTSAYFDDDVCEFVYSNRILTTFESALLDGYMAWKWGVVDRLTASHPFKNRPPLIGD